MAWEALPRRPFVSAYLIITPAHSGLQVHVSGLLRVSFTQRRVTRSEPSTEGIFSDRKEVWGGEASAEMATPPQQAGERRNQAGGTRPAGAETLRLARSHP